MELPDITEINDGESKKKQKKSISEECSNDETKHKKVNLKERRKFREKKSDEEMEKRRKEKNLDKPKEKEWTEKDNDQNEKSVKVEIDKESKEREKHKDRRRDWQNEKEKEADRTKSKMHRKESESEKKDEKPRDKQKEIEPEDRKEKQKKKDEEKKVERTRSNRLSYREVGTENEKIKNGKMQRVDESLRKKISLEKSHELNKEKSNDNSEDIRLSAEAEARRIEQRTDRRNNPMDFVKKIAHDINKRLNVSTVEVQVENKTNQVNDVPEKSHENSFNVNKKTTTGGTLNDSLHAVSQYEDREIDIKQSKVKEKPHSNHRSLSRSKKERSRSLSKTNKITNKEQNLVKRKDRSRSRSFQRNLPSRSRRRSRSNSQQSSSRRVFQSRSPKQNKASRSRSPHKDSRRHQSRSTSPHVKSRSKDIQKRLQKSKDEKSNNEKSKDEKSDKITDKKGQKEKPNDAGSNKYQSCTDFKRKPTLQRDHQASSALLKRAMAEVVVGKPLVDVKVTDNEGEDNYDDNLVKLEKRTGFYDGNIDNALHIKSNEDVSSDNHSRDRRVINIDQSQITVSFNVNDSQPKLRSKGTLKEQIKDQLEDKNGTSKHDARYAILKSREHNSKQVDRYPRYTIKEPRKKEYPGSMVADIEEQARKQQRHARRKMLRNNKRHLESIDKDSYPQKRIIDDSSESDPSSQTHTDILKTETRRIELQEISRLMKPAVDLRELLKRDKPLSDDEDVLARKLRQKLKEEKHKRLFGKLAPGEETKLKEERMHLRKELKKRTSDKKVSKQSFIEKENSIDAYNKEVSAEEEYSDEWVENKPVRNSSIENESEVEGEIENKQTSFNEEIQFQNTQCSNERDSNNEDSMNEELSLIDKEAGSIKQKGSKKDEVENNETKIYLEKEEGSADDLNNCVEEEVEEDGAGSRIITSTKTEDQLSKKENNTKEKVEKRKRSSKRRRVKHEFIVTLDGIDGSRHLSIHTGSCSPTQGWSGQLRKTESRERIKSSSFTHSDEEFEEIMKKKDKECEQLERKRKHHESRHSYHRRRKTSDDVERELELAEQKLKAQKLLRKSLEQVQNLDTTMLIEKPKHKTFINPHFQPKMTVPTIDNVSGSLNNFCSIPSLQLVMPTSSVETNMLTENKELINSNLPLKYPSELKEPITSHVQKAAASLVVDSGETTNVKVVVEESSLPEQTSRISIQERCVYWPSCKNSFCKFVHPNIVCKAFPKCSFGDRCLYIHPLCKFGERCKVTDCSYTHSKSSSLTPGSQQMCNFGINCSKLDCIFKHPIQMACRYGNTCKNRDCLYTHEKPATGSSLKWTAGKSHVSERSFAVEESKVTEAPVAIVISQN